MTIFQLLMLGASAFFAYKIYEHIQTLKDPEEITNNIVSDDTRSIDAFSTFGASDLIQKADEAVAKGDLQKALAIYSEANVKEKNNDEILFKMGHVLVQQNRNDEALEYFQEALSLDDNNPFTHLELAYIHIKNEDMSAARTHLNAALDIDSEFSKAKEELIKLDQDT